MTFAGHPSVYSVCVTPERSKVVTGSRDCTPVLRRLLVTPCASVPMRYGRWEHGRRCSDDCTAKVFDIATGECVVTIAGHTKCINSVCVTLNGSKVITGSRTECFQSKKLQEFPISKKWLLFKFEHLLIKWHLPFHVEKVASLEVLVILQHLVLT